MKKAYVGALVFVLCLWAISAMALPEGAVGRFGKGTVEDVTFSPDGKYLAVASSIGIWLYDAVTFAEVRLIEINGWVSSISFSPDGRLLAAITVLLEHVKMGANTIWLLDVESEEGGALEDMGNFTSISFSPNGKLLASGSDDGTVKLWDVPSGEEVKTLIGHTGSVNSVSFSPDGKILASESDDNTVKLWNVSSGKEVKTLRNASSVTFSPNGELLVIDNDDKIVKLWDIPSGKVVKTLMGCESTIESVSFESVSFSPDGKLLASEDGREIKLWDVKSGALVKTLIGHTSYINSITFSPDGKLLASGSDDGTVKLWDLQSGVEFKTFMGHTGSVNSVSYSPAGKLLASGNGDGTVKIWDVKSGRLVRTFEGHTGSVESVTFSPDGKLLASGGGREIKLWNVESGVLVRTLEHTDWVTSVTFSPDGKLLASGSDNGTVKLWDVPSGEEVKTLMAHTSSVNSVSFSLNRKLLASGSRDNTVKLWDVPSGEVVKTLKHLGNVRSIFLSPNGRLLTESELDRPGSIVRQWDMSSGKEVKTEGWVYGVDINCASFSPDGKLLVGGGHYWTVGLWNVESEEEVKMFEGHTSDVKFVAFSPDCRLLASGSEDGTVLLWDVKPYIDDRFSIGDYVDVTKTEDSGLNISNELTEDKPQSIIDYPVKPWDQWVVYKDSNFGDYRKSDSAYHAGIDLVLKDSIKDGVNKPVYAIADGEVFKVDQRKLGWSVVLKHTLSGQQFIIPEHNSQGYQYKQEKLSTIFSVYIHIKPIDKLAKKTTQPNGIKVEKGEIIGYIAEMPSGIVPHLHFEIRHPNAKHSSGGSMLYPNTNWSSSGDYLNMQTLVESGARNPLEFLKANVSFSDNSAGKITNSSASEPIPTITKVEPNQASLFGGTEITITGTGFNADPAPTVTIGGVPAAFVKVISKTTLRVTVPASSVAGPADIVVQNANAKVKSLPFKGFSYYEDVSVTAISPDFTMSPPEGVEAPDKIDVTFNQDVDPVSVVIKVTDSTDAEVAGKVAQDATDPRMFSFTPDTPFKAGWYTLTISGAKGTAAGNVMTDMFQIFKIKHSGFK